MSDYVARKQREKVEWETLDRQAIKALSLEELRERLVASYKRELEVTLCSREDAEILATFYSVEIEWPKRRQQSISQAQEAVEKLTSSQPDLGYWSKAEYWTVKEASALLTGLDPDRLAEVGSWERLMKFTDFEVRLKEFFNVLRLLGRKVNEEQRLWSAPSNSHFDPLAFGWARLHPVDVLDWADGCGVAYPSGLRQNLLRTDSERRGWPWGGHETDLLRHFAAAGDRFWSRYDPEDQTTAPKNDDVVAWLKSRGVAERNAQVMATMLRADDLAPGPRK